MMFGSSFRPRFSLSRSPSDPSRPPTARVGARLGALGLTIGGVVVLHPDLPPVQAGPAARQASLSRSAAKPATSGEKPVTSKPDQAAAEAPRESSPAAAPAGRPVELDADTQAELRECQTTLVPGKAVASDSRNRPELVLGRRRVFDRVRGYVCIPSYAISPRPVTQAQYEAVTGVRPHGRDFVATRPVFVSFVQAVHYCNTVSLSERLTPCYEVRVDKKGKETVSWPNRGRCTGYRLPAPEEAAAYDRGTDSEWTWAPSALPLYQAEMRSDAPRGFYLVRGSAPAVASPGGRHAKR
jgi:formylglycine-generating enzyme required for sulfatase activity